ncbi:uncharacterized protein VNE69_02263 [Vairimorpha necatrix]|uniref:Uncharacterized protein n=1 Tax=Vairimorpha necatrix TaxID=6039 RepID=A0AAX4J9R3_9MICR
MLFVFLFDTCKAGREMFELLEKQMIKTNETIYTNFVEYVDSTNVYIDPFNYTACDTYGYFSHMEVLNSKQIDDKDLRFVSRYIYRIFKRSESFKEIIRLMENSKTLRREIFKFKNFHKYVSSYINNIRQSYNYEHKFLFLKSLAFKCYKLIYLLSFIDLDEQTSEELTKVMVENMLLKTKDDCQWQITQILKTEVFDVLIEALETVVYKDGNEKKHFVLPKFN